MILVRLLIIGMLMLSCSATVMAQESVGLPANYMPSSPIKKLPINSPAPEIFKQDTWSVNVPLKRVEHDTQDFAFIPYTDYASALASHCQLFKEQGQDLWWANCGEPINDFTVVSNMNQE